jgi:hypothetical protein
VAISGLSPTELTKEAPIIMLHIGLDLSRRRLDFDLLCEDGSRLERGAVPPDADGLRGLARRVGVFGEPVSAAIESMNGAVRARPSRGARLAGRDRRRAEGQGLGAAVYRERYQRTAKRLGAQRRKIARVDIARKLTEAIWYLLTRNQPFAPAGATTPLAA